jgi:hypothetical protein
MEISTIGIDIGKSCFHVVGFDARGTIVLRRRCSQTQLIRKLANAPMCRGDGGLLWPIIEPAVGTTGIDGDRRDHLTVARSEPLPRASFVGEFVDAVAHRQIGSDDAGAGADVDDVRAGGATAITPIDPSTDRRRAGPSWRRSLSIGTRRRCRSRRRKFSGGSRLLPARGRVPHVSTRCRASAFRERQVLSRGSRRMYPRKHKENGSKHEAVRACALW